MPLNPCPGRRSRTSRTTWILAAALLLGPASARAEVTLTLLARPMETKPWLGMGEVLAPTKAPARLFVLPTGNVRLHAYVAGTVGGTTDFDHGVLWSVRTQGAGHIAAQGPGKDWRPAAQALGNRHLAAYGQDAWADYSAFNPPPSGDGEGESLPTEAWGTARVRATAVADAAVWVEAVVEILPGLPFKVIEDVAASTQEEPWLLAAAPES